MSATRRTFAKVPENNITAMMWMERINELDDRQKSEALKVLSMTLSGSEGGRAAMELAYALAGT